MANAHRRRNCLKKIRIKGSWCECENAVEKGIVDAFQGLFSNPSGWRPSLFGLSFKQMRGETAASLEVPITKDEVFAAVSDLNGDKAP